MFAAHRRCGAVQNTRTATGGLLKGLAERLQRDDPRGRLAAPHLQQGDTLPRTAATGVGCRTRIEVQRAVSALDYRPMSVTADYDGGCVRHDRMSGIVDDYPHNVTDSKRRPVRQAMGPRTRVGVAAGDHHRGDGFELDKDVGTTDITRVHDEIDSVEDLANAGVQLSVGIGDDADGRGATDLHARGPAPSSGTERACARQAPGCPQGL